MPGLARAVSPSTVHIGIGLRHLYSISWLFGFFTALISYFTLMKVFPAKSTLTRRDEVLIGLNMIESDLEHQHGSEIVEEKVARIPEGNK